MKRLEVYIGEDVKDWGWKVVSWVGDYEKIIFSGLIVCVVKEWVLSF